MAGALHTLVFLAIPLMASERAILFTSGPFEVYSRAGDKAGREALNRLEQFRYAFGTVLGKPDLQSVWPIRIIVVRPAKEQNITLHRDLYLGSLDPSVGVPRPFWRDLAKIFLDANAAPMTVSADRGLIDLFSTLEASGTHVTLGAPLPPAERNRDWARMHLLAVHPDYSGKLRVLLANLQRGIDPYPAYRNAFEKTPEEIEKQLDAYMQAGQYGTTEVSGRPISPQRDFIARTAPEPSGDVKSAVDLLEAGDLAGAAKTNPRWGEPLYRMAQATSDPGKKVEYIKKAIAVEPRNPKYREALAQSLEANKLAIEEAKRRSAEEERRHVEQLRDDALRRIREAEMKANEGKKSVDPGKVQEWWEGPKPAGKVTGTLQRVDCAGGKARLVVQASGGKPIQLLVRDPGQIVIQGGGVTSLGCGIQKPARDVTVEYFPKPDPKMGTAGDVAVIEFH